MDLSKIIINAQTDPILQKACVPVKVVSHDEIEKTYYLPEFLLIELDKEYYLASKSGNFKSEEFAYYLSEFEDIDLFLPFILDFVSINLEKNEKKIIIDTIVEDVKKVVFMYRFNKPIYHLDKEIYQTKLSEILEMYIDLIPPFHLEREINGFARIMKKHEIYPAKALLLLLTHFPELCPKDKIFVSKSITYDISILSEFYIIFIDKAVYPKYKIIDKKNYWLIIKHYSVYKSKEYSFSKKYQKIEFDEKCRYFIK